MIQGIMQAIWKAVKIFWAAFKKFGEFMASIINFFLLIPVYFIGIGVSSLFMKLSNEEAMNIEKKEKQKTYWKEYNLGTKKKEEYKRMF